MFILLYSALTTAFLTGLGNNLALPMAFRAGTLVDHLAEHGVLGKAYIAAAVTFGAGHIVNLLTGHGSVDTVLQMAYAIAIGFAFVMCFYKSGSLIPCIITHSMIDLTSKFSNHNISEQAEQYWNYGATVFIILVVGAYALYLRKVNKKYEDDFGLE